MLLGALAGCGSNDGSSTAQSQRSTVRSATEVACPDNVLCIVGDHWDTVACRCVPDDDAGDAALGDDGSAKPDGGSGTGDAGDAGSCPNH